jgi:putative membrane protein
MWQLLARWLITSIAVGVAAFVVPGIGHDGQSALIAIVVTAAILGFLNAILRPILKFLSCGLIVATLGLFVLVINAFVFWLAAWVSQNWFNTGFYVDGFWPAFWGSIVISIVSFFLSVFVRENDDEELRVEEWRSRT